MHSLKIGAAALAAVALVLACGGDSNEPNDHEPGGPFAIGDTVVATYDNSDPVTYTLTPTTAGELSLFLQAEQGGGVLRVTDAAGGDVATVGSAVEGAELFYVWSSPFPIAAGQTLTLTVQPSAPGPVRLRFWTYRINRAPETASATLALGDTVDNETLDNPADIDEFTVTGAASDTHIGFFAGSTGSAASTIVMIAQTTDGATLGQGILANNDAGELESRATGRYIVPGSSSYRVIVRNYQNAGSASHPGTGNYTVAVRRVNLLPDSVPATLNPGDTLSTESIDHVGDVDRFQVPVTPGYYNIFLQAKVNDNPAHLRAAYTMGGNTGSTESVAGDSALKGQYTSVLHATSATNVLVEVTGLSDVSGLDRGGYRLFVYAIDTLPEHSPATIAVGDSVTTETIEYPGDIDHFTIAGGTDTLNLVLRRFANSTSPMTMTWKNGTRLCGLQTGETIASCPSGTLIRTGGSTFFRLNADILGQTLPFIGGYRIVTLPISGASETGTTQLNDNVTVNGAIDPVGDYDDYPVNLPPGTPFEVTVNSTADVFGSLTGTGELGGAPGTSDGASTRRLFMPLTGVVKVRVASDNSGTIADQVGNYTVLAHSLPATPETANAVLALNDSVTTESIDALGDVDDFIFNGTPGAVYAATMRPITVRLQTIIPGDTAAITGNNGGTGRITMPAGGSVKIRVAESRFPAPTTQPFQLQSMPYGLVIHQILSAPEQVSASITIGQTVTGESIDVDGDLDEFSFAGTQGQSISLFLDNFVSINSIRVRLNVVDPQTGLVIGSTSTTSQTPITSASFTLPGTRNYVVRVESIDPTVGRGAYTFRVQTP